MQRIFFRADGKAQMGLGHIYRSLALATMLGGENYERCFVIRDPLPAVKSLLAAEDIALTNLPGADADEAERFAADVLRPGDIVVTDGYHFDQAYQHILKTSGCILVCIDDIYTGTYAADAIINHAGGITPAHYHAQSFPVFALGLRYSLIRPEFLTAGRPDRDAGGVVQVLISFGGGDVNDYTRKALEQLRQFPNLYFHATAGAAYPHLKQLTAFVAEHDLAGRVTIHQSLPQALLADLMRRCCIGVCAPSTIAYEYAAIGGGLFLEQTADNQKDVLRYFTEAGLAGHLRDFTTDKAVIDGFAARQREQLNAAVVERHRKLFALLSRRSSLRVRTATPDDLMLYFNWANDPDTRAAAFSTGLIPLDAHTGWFKKRLASPDALLLVIEKIGDTPIGQVRFDRQEDTAIISYSVDKTQRGKGYGLLALQMAMQHLAENNVWDVRWIAGEVKGTNASSLGVFRSLGFQQETANTETGVHRFVTPMPGA